MTFAITDGDIGRKRGSQNVLPFAFQALYTSNSSDKSLLRIAGHRTHIHPTLPCGTHNGRVFKMQLHTGANLGSANRYAEPPVDKISALAVEKYDSYLPIVHHRSGIEVPIISISTSLRRLSLYVKPTYLEVEDSCPRPLHAP